MKYVVMNSPAEVFTFVVPLNGMENVKFVGCRNCHTGMVRFFL